MNDSSEKPNLNEDVGDDSDDETSNSGSSDSHLVNIQKSEAIECAIAENTEDEHDDNDTFHSCSENHNTDEQKEDIIIAIDSKNATVEENAKQLTALHLTPPKQQQHPPPISSSPYQGRPSLSRQASKQLSRQRSKFFETLEIPDTPAGWTVIVSAFCSAILNYEMQLQKKLTCPPQIFGQVGQSSSLTLSSSGGNGSQDDRYGNEQMNLIYKSMTKTPNSVFSRSIEPALFVGTRAVVASTAAYLLGGPSEKEDHPRVRQILKSSQDGAKIAIDWELPPLSSLLGDETQQEQQQQHANKTLSPPPPLKHEERIQQFLKQPIEQPVVLVLHGINNHANFGYMKSLMREFSNRGWVAAGMNYRGCGGIPLETPRSYTGAYTGDLREVVHYISGRLATTTTSATSLTTNPSLFLVGNSIGANIMTKYLGEEGFSGSLPACVAGGVSLGNPLTMNTSNVKFPMGHVLGLGVKKDMLFHLPRYRYMMTNPEYRKCIRNAMLSNTLADIDDAIKSVLIRNDPYYPFTPQVGYHNNNGVQEYWNDASSYRMVQHVSVPLLLLKSKDDFLCYGPSSRKLSYCLENPKVMVAKTKCGGHLGWQERPPPSSKANHNDALSFGASWANIATADFIESILQTQGKGLRTTPNTKMTSPHLRSRL